MLRSKSENHKHEANRTRQAPLVHYQLRFKQADNAGQESCCSAVSVALFLYQPYSGPSRCCPWQMPWFCSSCPRP